VTAQATALEEATKKVAEIETEIANLKESTKPYIDILEGLVTYMRDNGILITEAEVVKAAAEMKEEVAVVAEDEATKALAGEMTATINAQQTKLDEALARITALETEKTALEEAKQLAEAAQKKAEIESAITDILTKEHKYAAILKPKLEAASTLEDVKKVYESEKAFIETIEKLNVVSTTIPAGEGKVQEAEVIKDEKIVTEGVAKEGEVLTEAMSSDDKMAALKSYQRQLAGIK
jgi:cell division protein FtsB